MLKLEKNSDSSNISICVRKKECFFDSLLLKALAIALLIHCGAIILFQVTPFSFTSTYLFPPVHVQSDSFLGVSVIAFDPISEDEISPPPLAWFPPLDWISFSHESILTPSIAFDLKPLESLETSMWPKWEAPLSLKLEEPRIQLTISGHLAELSIMTNDPLLHEMQPIASHDSAIYVTYNVQVDERTGEVFWIERLESGGVPAIDQLTEKILLNLRFSLPQFPESITGTLSFVVLPSNALQTQVKRFAP